MQSFAKEQKIKLIIHLPKWTKYGYAAGPIRNKLIVHDCTHMIAFIHENSVSTIDFCQYALKQNIPVTRVYI